MTDFAACPRIDDAAGYVLGALPDAEAGSYRGHLEECDACAGKVAELRFVSSALLNAVPQLSAPPELRERIMSVVRAEAELLRAAGPEADRPVRRRTRRVRFTGLRPLTAGALAAVVLGLGLGIGVLGREPACTTRAATVDRAAGARASGKLEICGDSATLALTGMAAPPDGRIYELWLYDPGNRSGPKPAGLFSVRDGHASVSVGKLESGMTVLVTHEPLPNGSKVPTRLPVVKVSSA